MNYILQKDFNWFGKTIPAGTRYVQHGADYWWPEINDAHVPAMQVTFTTIMNNPVYFKEETTAVYKVEQHDTFKGVPDKMHYQFAVSRAISDEEKEVIRIAIEMQLNARVAPAGSCSNLHMSQIEGYKG